MGVRRRIIGLLLSATNPPNPVKDPYGLYFTDEVSLLAAPIVAH